MFFAVIEGRRIRLAGNSSEGVNRSYYSGHRYSGPQEWMVWRSLRAKPLELNYMAQLFVITLND